MFIAEDILSIRLGEDPQTERVCCRVSGGGLPKARPDQPGLEAGFTAQWLEQSQPEITARGWVSGQAEGKEGVTLEDKATVGGRDLQSFPWEGALTGSSGLA